METEKLMLVQKELELLTKHLKASDLSAFNKKRLTSELESAVVVKEEDLPADTVCMDADVEIREVEAGKNFSFQIVMPADADMQKKRVSVFAPIAIAILGYRRGSTVQWEMPNGLKTFEILKVNHREKIQAAASRKESVPMPEG
jgi:regulator of nucleoside diphosphate kinase